MHRLDGMLDPTSAAAVLTTLGALSGEAGQIDERSVGQRRADALVTLALQALDAGTLPDVGGNTPHLIATIPYDTLKAKLHAAGTSTAKPPSGPSRNAAPYNSKTPAAASPPAKSPSHTAKPTTRSTRPTAAKPTSVTVSTSASTTTGSSTTPTGASTKPRTTTSKSGEHKPNGLTS